MRPDALHRFAPSPRDCSVPGASTARRVLRRDPAAEDRSCERPVRLCRSIRDALRGTSLPVTSLRSCRVGVTRMRNPVSRRSLLSPLLRSLPLERDRRLLSRDGRSPVRAQPRLDRARAPRGTRAAAIPVRSTDICNPQDLFSTTSPTVSVRSESCCPRDSGAAGSTPATHFGDPCAAFQQHCARRDLLRLAPHGVPLTSSILSPRAIGTSPALAWCESSEPSFVAPRERSRRGIRLRTPFTLSCLSPRPTNRPKRVALDRSSRQSRKRHSELLQRFTDPRALLGATSPRLSRVGQRAAEA